MEVLEIREAKSQNLQRGLLERRELCRIKSSRSPRCGLLEFSVITELCTYGSKVKPRQGEQVEKFPKHAKDKKTFSMGALHIYRNFNNVINLFC